MTAVDIVQAITNGDVDDQLKTISQAIRERDRFIQNAKAAENQAALRPGTRVEICGRITPKYLIGLRGAVTTTPPRRRGDLTVKLDIGASGLSFGRVAVSDDGELAIPAMCLKTVA